MIIAIVYYRTTVCLHNKMHGKGEVRRLKVRSRPSIGRNPGLIGRQWPALANLLPMATAAGTLGNFPGIQHYATDGTEIGTSNLLISRGHDHCLLDRPLTGGINGAVDPPGRVSMAVLVFARLATEKHQHRPLT